MENIRIDNLEAMCDVLFRTAAEGQIVTNKKGEVLIVNPKAEVLFGYTSDEFKTLKIEDLVPQKHRHGHEGHRGDFAKDPRPRSMGKGMDLTALAKDGSEFPVEIGLSHFVFDGEFLIMCLVSDISERKASQQKIIELNLELEQRVEKRTNQLRESQLLHSMIARHYPNGTINVFDADFTYVFVEGMELHKAGISGASLIGTNYLDRIPMKVKDTIEEKLQSVLNGQNTEFEIESNDNYYVMQAVGLPNDKGIIDQILVVEQNITSQKKAELELQKTLEAEKQLNELKSRFVSMASHEFRTPLSTILSSVSLIERYQDDSQLEKRMKHVNRIKNGVQSLTEILNDFLSLDKLEAGKISTNISPFDLHACASQAKDEVQQIASQGQVITHEHRGGNQVKLDPGVVKNIILNLLSNACKYSPADGKIVLRTEVLEDEVIIEVEDNGIGIPEEDQKHMFERFFRAQNSTNIQGTGLGLNIVKKYTELMEGNIIFTSKLGEGSCFKVRMPRSVKTKNVTEK